MPKNGKYPDELRERAVRLVLDHGHEYGRSSLVSSHSTAESPNAG